MKGCDINPPMPSADGHQPKGVKSSASLPEDIEKIKTSANAEFEQVSSNILFTIQKYLLMFVFKAF